MPKIDDVFITIQQTSSAFRGLGTIRTIRTLNTNTTATTFQELTFLLMSINIIIAFHDAIPNARVETAFSPFNKSSDKHRCLRWSLSRCVRNIIAVNLIQLDTLCSMTLCSRRTRNYLL